MAGNEDVIETLSLNIRVGYKGRNNLTKFREELAQTTPTLESFNGELERFSALIGSLNVSSLASSIRQLSQSMRATNNAYTGGRGNSGSGRQQPYDIWLHQRGANAFARNDDWQGPLNYGGLASQAITGGNFARNTAQSNATLVPALNESLNNAPTYQTLGGGNMPDTTTLFRLPRTLETIASSGSRAAQALKNVGNALKSSAVSNAQKFSEKIKELVKSFGRIILYRSIRTILKNITEGFTEGVQNLARYSSEFNSVMSRLSTASLYFKNAIGTLVEPILTQAIPILEQLINKIVEVINVINQYIAIMNGATTWNKAKTYQVDYAKSLDKTNSSANKLKKTLMSFDEINMLSDNSSASEGMDYSSMFTTEKVGMSDEAVARVRRMIKTIERMLGPALMALGTILCATGHLPLGIGMIIAGCKITKASLNFDYVGGKVEEVLTKIMTILGTALLVIGAIIAFASPGHLALGIGLMVAGAVMVGSSIVMNWAFMDSKIAEKCSIIGGILSASLLVIGAILTFSSANPVMGIGLMVAGAVGLGVSVTVNWDNIKTKIYENKEKISDVLTTGGKALMALGAILCLSGAALPLGLGLLFAGAGMVYGGKAIQNFDGSDLKKAFTDTFNSLKLIVKDAINWIIDKINSVFNTNLKHIEIGASVSVTHGANGQSSHTGKFASGGFPDAGQMFIARESGPELVGSIGNRTAVANNQQITDGIAEATYSAFKQALSESSANGGQDIYIDGEKVFKVVKKRNDSYTKMYGMSPLTSY